MLSILASALACSLPLSAADKPLAQQNGKPEDFLEEAPDPIREFDDIWNFDVDPLDALDELLRNDPYLKIRDRTFVKTEHRTHTFYGTKKLVRYGWRDKAGVIWFSDGTTCKNPVWQKASLQVVADTLLAQKQIQNWQERDKPITTSHNLNGLSGSTVALWLKRAKMNKADKLFEHQLELADDKIFWSRRNHEDSMTRHRRELLGDEDTPAIKLYLHALGSLSPEELFCKACYAHMAGDFREAKQFLDRALQLHPELEKNSTHVFILRKELERRLRSPEKTYERPIHYSLWSEKQKASFLIASLEDISRLYELTQHDKRAEPNGIYDWRIQELIRLDYHAVPLLLDCAANDRRLSRTLSIEFTPIPVSQFAKHALGFISAGALNSEYCLVDFKNGIPTLASLKEYWNGKEHLNKTQRALLEIKSSNEFPRRQLTVAQQLLSLDVCACFGQHDFQFSWTPSPFNKPHEAVSEDPKGELGAFLVSKLSSASQKVKSHHRWCDQQAWTNLLCMLKDERVIPLLYELYPKANTQLRIRLASAALHSGDSKLVKKCSKQLLENFSDLTTKEKLLILDLFNSISAAEELIAKCLSPKSHGYDALRDALFTRSAGTSWKAIYSFSPTPHFIRFLIHELDNETPLKPRDDEEKFDGRICDASVAWLRRFIFDSPITLNTTNYSKELRAKIKQLYKTHGLRSLPQADRNFLGNDLPYYTFRQVLPLSQVASVKNMESGEAAFVKKENTLSEVAPLQLPCRAHWTSPFLESEVWPLPAIIYQAEVNAEGKLEYGAITRQGWLKLSADQVQLINPVWK